MKVDILAIGVHPDDVELSASGTILKHIAMGKTVGLLDLTRGELGTRGTPEIRDKEAQASAKKMGALFRKNLEMADGFFAHSKENILKIIEVVRWCQPEIILANSVEDRHPDHGRAAKLAAEACYLSGLVKIPTSGPGGKPQDRWRPKNVFHYIQDRNLTPDFVIDISPYMEEKIELILTFRSQFYLPEGKEYDKELATPISGEDFMEFMRAKGRSFGRSIGAEYAEGFIKSRVFGVDNLFDLI
ncbi:MAG TPA: bacillithiol biosynthesis deacetylase BshB1 [Bacteroidetes bacterium]|nr:bacillithiol biosynthesis deacetylase BshB1 [Bacteroidota bacterium]